MPVTFSNTLQENEEKKTGSDIEERSENLSDRNSETSTEEDSGAEPEDQKYLEMMLLNQECKKNHEKENSAKSEWIRNLLMRKEFQQKIKRNHNITDRRRSQDAHAATPTEFVSSFHFKWTKEKVEIGRWLRSLKFWGLTCFLPAWKGEMFLLSRAAGKLALADFLYDKGYIDSDYQDEYLEMINSIKMYMNNSFKNEIFITEYCKRPFTSDNLMNQINDFFSVVENDFDRWQEELEDLILEEVQATMEFRKDIPENPDLFWEKMHFLYKEKQRLFKEYCKETTEKTVANSCKCFPANASKFSFGCIPLRPDISKEKTGFLDDTTDLWGEYEEENKKEEVDLKKLVKNQWKLFKVYESRLPDKNPSYLMNLRSHKDTPMINIKDYSPKDGETAWLCKTLSCFEVLYWFFIFGVLLYLPMTDIIEFSNEKDIVLFIEFFFNIIPLSQFLSGTFYCNSPHFRGFLIDRITKDSKRHKKFKNAPYSIISASVFSTLTLSLAYSLLLFFFYNLSDFEIYMGTFYCFWSVPVIINNASFFYMVFHEHLSEITWLCEILEEGYGGLTYSFNGARKSDKNIQKNACFENFPQQKNPVDINELLIKISDFKNDLEASVHAFNSIYSYTSLFGFIGTTCIIATTFNNFRRKTAIFEFLEEGHVAVAAIVWLAMFTFFTNIGKNIDDNINKLKDTLNKPFYTQLYLRRYTDIGVHDNLLRTKVWQKANLLSRKQTDITLDWSVLNDVINKRWYEFNVFGLTIIPNIKNVITSIGVSALGAFVAII